MATPRKLDARPAPFKSPEVQQKARELYGLGRSDSEVAVALGISRSTATKFRQRKGIVTAYTVRAAANVANRAPKRPANRQGLIHRSSGDRRILKGVAWQALPDTNPVSLVDLEPGMCKWPIGEDSPFLFCGAHADGIYCEHHQKRSVN